MLNNNGERELAYVVKVDNITPMDADRLECAHIGGWHCVVGKGQFKTGDCAIYFEVDSQLPEVEPFTQIEFLKSKKYKIKIQKIRGEYSQGLLMPATMFGWNINEDYIVDSKGRAHSYTDESRFLTKELGVTYAITEDNSRKAPSQDRYKVMAQRHPNVFKKKWVRKLMRHEWGRKLMFLFFGKKKDKKTEWPSWVQKTDEERLENCPWILESDAKWIATEKIDGSSTTFTLKGRGRRQKFYVCSRNVVFDKPNKKCYYDTNIYLEMAEKYQVEEKMKAMMEVRYHALEEHDIDFITLQAETYGAGVQRRDYGRKDHDMAIFNVIIGYKNGKSIRMNPYGGARYAEMFGLPFVPIVAEPQILPKNVDEVMAMADGISKLDGRMREGLVFRTSDGIQSFKAVSREYLVKYHG